jgi:hypothetical protein
MQTSGLTFALNASGGELYGSIASLAPAATASFEFVAAVNANDAGGTQGTDTVNVSDENAQPSSASTTTVQ